MEVDGEVMIPIRNRLQVIVGRAQLALLALPEWPKRPQVDAHLQAVVAAAYELDRFLCEALALGGAARAEGPALQGAV
jgi:hypothetical protein